MAGNICAQTATINPKSCARARGEGIAIFPEAPKDPRGNFGVELDAGETKMQLNPLEFLRTHTHTNQAPGSKRWPMSNETSLACFAFSFSSFASSSFCFFISCQLATSHLVQWPRTNIRNTLYRVHAGNSHLVKNVFCACFAPIQRVFPKPGVTKAIMALSASEHTGDLHLR